MLRALLALLLPSTLLAACCTLGVVLTVAGPRLRRTRSVLLATGALGLAAAFLLPIDAWLLRPLENRFARAELPGHVDGVVVLGGAISVPIGADRASPTLNRDADRLVAFATLARRYPEARLVFAGGPPSPPSGGVGEAEASRALLEQLGVTPQDGCWMHVKPRQATLMTGDSRVRPRFS